MINDFQHAHIFAEIASTLQAKTERDIYDGDMRYFITNMIDIKNTLQPIRNLSVFAKEMAELDKFGVFTSTFNRVIFNEDSIGEFVNLISNIKYAVEKVAEYIIQNRPPVKPNSIEIKLPPLKNFSELSKIANEFKLAIEQPINMLEDNNNTVEITSVDNGSIWFTIALGSTVAISLIGRICMVALNVKQKKSVAEGYEEYSKSLGIHNDTLKTIADAQAKLVNEYVEVAIAEMSSTYYLNSDVEKHERLRIAIETVSNLYSKNALILPVARDLDIRKQFPTADEVKMLGMPLRQIEKEKGS